MGAFQENDGYSILPPAPPSLMEDRPLLPLQTTCTLLFLQVERARRWPEIFKRVAPQKRYEVPENRDELCPNNADRHHAIKNYQLTT
jgi:hypothetical protein